jgi:glycosyltransferase involved in cell wall biosynthesis
MGTGKRILFVRRTGGYGGAEVVVLDLLRAIDYETHSVELATTPSFSSVLSPWSLPFRVVPLTVRFTGNHLGVFASWLSFFFRARPDKIILAEGNFYDLPLLGVLAAYLVSWGEVYVMALHPPPDFPRKASRKHWGFVPGIAFWWHRLLWGARLKGWGVRKTLAVSNGVKEKLVRQYGFSQEKTQVIYYGVDTSVFSPPTADVRSRHRAAYGIPEDAIVIVSTARLNDDKRLDWLIKAFAASRLTHDNLWMLLTGEGPRLEDLQALARSVDSDDRIKFLGFVPDVRVALLAANIYVLPSLEEGFGIALVEAMACGLVCVATKTTGPSEVIEDGKTGLLVELTYEGVLEGLRKALALSKEERESMTTSARQMVLKRFRLEDSVAKGLVYLEIRQAGQNVVQ